MSFSWENFADLAKELNNIAGYSASQESKWRTAVSRAYYAAFCSARNYLQNRGEYIASSKGNVHLEVSELFSTSQNVQRQRIGNWLKQMHRQRKRADYEDEMPDSNTQAEIIISRADDVFKNLAQI